MAADRFLSGGPWLARSITLFRGDFRSRSWDANRRSLLSCSAATAAASDCFPKNRRCCTNLVIIESIRLDNDVVISVLRTSASPSRSVPETGGANAWLRSMFSLSVKSELVLGWDGCWGEDWFP